MSDNTLDVDLPVIYFNFLAIISSFFVFIVMCHWSRRLSFSQAIFSNSTLLSLLYDFPHCCRLLIPSNWLCIHPYIVALSCTFSQFFLCISRTKQQKRKFYIFRSSTHRHTHLYNFPHTYTYTCSHLLSGEYRKLTGKNEKIMGIKQKFTGEIWKCSRLERDKKREKARHDITMCAVNLPPT